MIRTIAILIDGLTYADKQNDCQQSRANCGSKLPVPDAEYG